MDNQQKVQPQMPKGEIRLPNEKIKISTNTVTSSGTITPNAEIVKELEKASSKGIIPPLKKEDNG